MKRITQENLQTMYPPMPEDFTGHALSSLPHGEEKIRVKRKISVAFVLAAVLTLLAAGGMAAANWDALHFLYGVEKQELQGMQSQVAQAGRVEGVTLNVDTAVTDGRALSFAWTMTLEDAQLPLYFQTEEMTINGETYYSTAGEGLNCAWVQPGEAVRRGGELLVLREAEQQQKVLHVEMRLGIYKPKEKVVFLTEAERNQAEALREQGVWAVAPIAHTMTRRLDTNGEPAIVDLWLREAETEEDRLRFERSEMKISFDVSVPEGNQVEQLEPAVSRIEKKDHVILVEGAVRTELGIYAMADIVWDAAQQDAAALQKRYILSVMGPWDAFLSGVQFYDPGCREIGEDGKLHCRYVASVVGYQEAVIRELNALTLDIYDRVTGEQDKVRISLRDPDDAAEEDTFERKLTPLQESIDLPEGKLLVKEIARDAHRQLWATFHLIPEKNTMEACKLLEKQVKASLGNGKGEPFKVQMWDEGTYTDVSIHQQENGELYLRISTGVVFLRDLPWDETAAVRLETGSGTYLFPFCLYE